MDIETAARILREEGASLTIRLAQPDDGALKAALARFETAGATVTGTPERITGLCIQIGPVELVGRSTGPVVLELRRFEADEAGTRILFRVMASLGRGSGGEVILASVNRPDVKIFRYRPGGPGLDHVATGEVVAPYDAETDV